ncbi:ferrochelatase [Thiotrichales bacterium 19S3-11]|nr:ferrochelatase [Thiotrichales bacterium 19S3-11]
MHGLKKQGVLLVNLGTPDAPTSKAVRRYLKPFLSDSRVINNQGILWKLVLNGILLNTRPKKVAKLYQSIWMENDQSPLLYYTQKQKHKLQQVLGDKFHVEIAMRYGNPSIEKALSEFECQQVSDIIILPLYPQNSATTIASVFDNVNEVFAKKRNLPSFQFISGYHTNPLYIDALVKSIEQFQHKNAVADKLIFSYHGLPKIYCEKGDPYQQACYETTKHVVSRLNLSKDQYIMCFQSRVGPLEWLQPYFDKTLIQLAKEGVQSIQVISPAFASDCLETLEEINMAGRESFLASGGKSFGYIPCLNDSDDHIQMMIDLITDA